MDKRPPSEETPAGEFLMRTGPDLILATKQFAHDSAGKSWWCVLSTSFLLAISFVGALLPLPWAVRLGFGVLQGLLTLRLFVIYHDQQHHAILPKSRAAEWFMRVFGIFALSASSIWRSSHNHHHNHNSKLKGSHIYSCAIHSRFSSDIFSCFFLGCA
jgi:acyl-lipid omega-6 desaturase (Delta-12 desaturase)